MINSCASIHCKEVCEKTDSFLGLCQWEKVPFTFFCAHCSARLLTPHFSCSLRVLAKLMLPEVRVVTKVFIGGHADGVSYRHSIEEEDEANDFQPHFLFSNSETPLLKLS